MSEDLKETARGIWEAISGMIEQSKADERNRIIALLEADMDNLGDDGKCVMTNHYPESCHCEIIAIIKGEQK